MPYCHSLKLARKFPSSHCYRWHLSSQSARHLNISASQVLFWVPILRGRTHGGVRYALTTMTYGSRQGRATADDGCRRSQKDGFVKIALTVEWLTGAVTVVCHCCRQPTLLLECTNRAADRQTESYPCRSDSEAFVTDMNYCESTLPSLVATPNSVMQASIDVSKPQETTMHRL